MNNYKIVGILRCSNFVYKELVTGDDLNNALGHYRTIQTAIIKSLVNRPAGLDKGGEITVDWYPSISDNAYGTQIIRQAHAGITYIYTRSKIGLTSWGTWDTFIKNSDLGGNFCIVGKNLKNNGPGRTICFNGNNIGTTYTGGDSYYIAVDNSQAIHVGYQIGGSTVVTWASK